MTTSTASILKSFCLLLGFSLYSQFIHAQQTPSYRTYLKSDAPEHVALGQELSKYYVSENLDSMLILGENLFFYGIDNSYQPAIEQGKITLGEYYIQIGNITMGLELLKSLLSVAEEQEDNALKLQLFKAITLGYCKAQDAKSARVWSAKIQQIQQTQVDEKMQIEGDLLHAETLLLLKKRNEAIVVYQTYITKAKKIKFHRGLASAYAKLGDVYRSQNDLKRAENYFRLSYEAAKKTNLTTPMANAINNLAILYFENGDVAKAKIHFEKALELRLDASNQRAICESYYNLGDFYFYSDRISESISWYNKSYEHARKYDLLPDQKDALIAIANAYKASEDYKNAYLFQQQAMNVLGEITIKNAKDDEELAKLQEEIWQNDHESNLNKKSPTATNLLVWILGGLLFVSLVVIALLSRKKNQFNFPGNAN